MITAGLSGRRPRRARRLLEEAAHRLAVGIRRHRRDRSESPWSAAPVCWRLHGERRGFLGSPPFPLRKGGGDWPL